MSQPKLGLPKKVKCVSSRHSCRSRNAREVPVRAGATELQAWRNESTCRPNLGALLLALLCVVRRYGAPHLWYSLKLQTPVVVQVLERQHARPRRQPSGKVNSQQRSRDRWQRVVPVHRAAARRVKNAAVVAETRVSRTKRSAGAIAGSRGLSQATHCSPIIHTAHLALPRRHGGCRFHYKVKRSAAREEGTNKSIPAA